MGPGERSRLVAVQLTISLCMVILGHEAALMMRCVYGPQIVRVLFGV
jgi:hypothetical protein